MPPGLKLSIVIASYRPGEGFLRVINSLDAQTLPQDEFEVIVVDDGSPDDTFEILKSFAAQRSNMSIHRIENSGWPSKPRNVGVTLAKGEWVFFMDHDDSLFSDGLRRAVEFATETRADLLSVKESKTSDAWWGMYALRDGNLTNALESEGIDRLLPMVPHKLYRRDFLLAHDIKFPEGRRQLWEDIYVNIEAWRNARVVAVLADTPVYLWHSSQRNNSKSYGPLDSEFWDRLEDLLTFAYGTLDGPEYFDALRVVVLQQWRSRILTRLSQSLLSASNVDGLTAIARARNIATRFVPVDWDLSLGKHERARAYLLRAGRPDLLAELRKIDAGTKLDAIVTACVWLQGRLHVEIEARLVDEHNEPLTLLRSNERLLRDLPTSISSALPLDVLDLTDTLESIELDLALRDRRSYVTWAVQTKFSHSWEESRGRAYPLLRVAAVIDIENIAFGAQLDDHTYDVIARYRWSGAARASAARFVSPSRPAIVHGRQAVAYSTRSASLAIDLSGDLRNVVADGGTLIGQSLGTGGILAIPLPKVATFEAETRRVKIRLISKGGNRVVILDGLLATEGSGAVVRSNLDELVDDGIYGISFSVTGAPSFLGGRRVRIRATTVTMLDSYTKMWPRMLKHLRPLVRKALGR